MNPMTTKPEIKIVQYHRGDQNLSYPNAAPPKELKRGWQWAIAVLTTTHREGGMLARTLESYRGSGFAPPVVFTDANKSGGLWNLYRALKTLVEQQPNADAYMIIEDDVLFSKDIREYLEAELWPSVGEHGCICSIFTPTIYSSKERWHAVNRGKWTWMSQCRIYHPCSAKKMVVDLENDTRMQNKWRQVDETVGEWAKQNNVSIWFHSPSLTQHISPRNTSYEANRPLDYRVGMARDFIGEDRSIREYWAEFGTEPRKILRIPRLEIVARRACAEQGTEFQFLPDMARRLADKLNQYNCDIEEISFVGDRLLSWEYAGRCVYPLRMTGKVLRTKITIPLPEKVNMRPYELLFDAISLEEDGTNPHLTEKYAGKPFYTIRPRDQEAMHRPGIPRLVGDEVFLYLTADGQMTEGHGSEYKSEAPDVYKWTLDEFFQNLDDILSGLEEQKTCKSCGRYSEKNADQTA